MFDLPAFLDGNNLYYAGAAGGVLLCLVVWLLVRSRRQAALPTPKSTVGVGVGSSAKQAIAGQNPATVEAELAVPTGSTRRSLFSQGLAKTRGGFIARIGELVGSGKQIDERLLSDVEEVLLSADVGIKTSTRLLESVREQLSRADLKNEETVWRSLREESERILRGAGETAINLDSAHPFVILVIGVNGVGKTTTIGKLAARWTAAGKKVLLAAGDTFRAAATQQLDVWAERVGVPVVKGKEGADPASVIFEGAKRAQADGFDILIADTAGRLHTKSELMEELQKVRRVLGKAIPGAPHETLLVLDATNGQNAIMQAALFKQTVDLTGIVLTKLDGTAKGGVVLGICEELKVPVRFVGVGEKVGDLQDFDAGDFVAALYEGAQN